MIELMFYFRDKTSPSFKCWTQTDWYIRVHHQYRWSGSNKHMAL